MAYSTISKPSLHFNTKLYAGNSGTNNITGVGFQPDFVWIKKRNATGDHALFDAIRGVTKRLQSNENSAEATTADSLTSFDSDGFTLGSYSGANQNLLASWNWKANGAGSSNTDGTINSTVSLNSTSGFSIVSYTGTGSAGTIGHGLGVVPSAIIVKSLASADAWYVWIKGFSGTEALFLDSNQAKGSHASYWNSTTPTSSVYSVLNNTGTNNSGGMIAYCFAEKKGFSKFGSYKGNGNADGTFIYTGFKPAFVIVKRSGSTDSWRMVDNKRDVSNTHTGGSYRWLYPSSNSSEASDNASGFDFLSNGFKVRSTSAGVNANGENYIYLVFAEEPLVANVGASIPATAR